MRDDFLKRTITEIAKGAGYRCSNPECRRPTDGSNAAQDGTMTIGVAAHICAASQGGPRYSAAQTSLERRGKENGVWLCQTCGRLVDADPDKFTVELLRKWKYEAQGSAFRALVAPNTASGGEQARVEAAVTADDVQASDAAFDTLLRKVRSAAATDLAAHKRGPTWPGGNVELTLRIEDDRETPSFSIGKLPLAVEVAPEVTIVAPPGTGKTTTLLQLAGHALDGGLVVPLYFRLGDWSAGSTGLLASLSQRAAFNGIGAAEFAELAARGRLLLLLDGWNELETGSRNRLRIEVAQIRRDWPNVRIIVTTRRQMRDVPIVGPRVEIEPLSEDQQMAIADAGFGAAGRKIVDDAWRTAGIRELIATPLYLSALLSGGAKGASPATKEGVLRLFVAQHEQVGDHAEALQSTLLGCHTEILIELAVHLNAAGTTTVTEADARRIVTESAARLREEGQIAGSLEPLTALETLISHHTLMRSGGGVAFQHQQFQEWYASNEVDALMRASAEGDTSARVRLRAAILDQPAWEESVLFAVERLSREADRPSIAAAAIRLALPIDPMLAAEMIYRSAPAVWGLVKAEILAFGARWHKPGKVDRAVRFMIMTGQPEFAEHVWPLASSIDTQTELPTLRIAPRFRPQVLGADLPAKVTNLPEETREHLLGLIALESGVDGMDLAVELARADPSPKVQAEVVQYLQFRRGDRHVAALLSAAHAEAWVLIASRGYAEEIRDPVISARLRALRQTALEQASDPSERLDLLLEQPAEFYGRDEAIASAIADPRFPINDRQRGSLHFAQQRAPIAVRQGLRQRLESGLKLPFHAVELLHDLPVTDEGPIAEAILDTSRENRNIDAAAVMAGPQTVGALVDKYLACARNLEAARNESALADEYHRVKDRIHGTRSAIFAATIVARADTDDPKTIALLAELVSQHGSHDEDRKGPIAVDPGTKATWVRILRRWVETVVTAPGGKRSQLNEISNAIGRFGFRELVPELKRLLDEELRRLKKAREGSADTRGRGDTSDVAIRYDNQYQASFTRIGGEEVAAVAAQYLEDRAFGIPAALILKSISDKRLQVPERDFHRRWPWFDDVAAARANRAISPRPSPLNTVADPIFAAIDRLARQEAEKEGQQLAIGLARIALSMTHGDQDALVTRVMSLPQPLATKQTLLAAMVLDGQIIDADLVMQAIDEWLADANNPKHAWHKRQNTWEIEPWLELLPFTTRPEAVLEGLTKVKAFYGTGWKKQWKRVLHAVAAVPAKEGLSLLAALARAHKDIADDHTWIHAILCRGTPDTVLLCTDLYIEGILGSERNGADAWHVGRQIAESVQRFPELKPELTRRYETTGPGPGHAMLEQIFGEAAGEDDLVAMIAKYAADGRAYDGGMARAVRAVTIDEVLVSEGSNVHNIYPAPVGRLRKTLFDLLGGSPKPAALANDCLVAIDRLRDEYGIAGGDTRHPDVMSERPWPLEVERH